MTVVAYYVNSKYKIRIRLIALRRLYEHHSSENQTKLLLSIIKDSRLLIRLDISLLTTPETTTLLSISFLRNSFLDSQINSVNSVVYAVKAIS